MSTPPAPAPASRVTWTAADQVTVIPPPPGGLRVYLDAHGQETTRDLAVGVKIYLPSGPAYYPIAEEPPLDVLPAAPPSAPGGA